MNETPLLDRALFFRRALSTPASASDAVESLLLLGEKPILAPDNTLSEVAGFRRMSAEGSYRRDGVMVNYYQKMRMRNNEASKRCRMKRRIKQESLDKTRMILERHRTILSQRLVRLNKIKDLLTEACKEFNSRRDGSCRCLKYVKSIWEIKDELEETNNKSNLLLVRESRIIRNTNLEEVLGAEICQDILKPMRRGPRKQEVDSFLVIDSETGKLKTSRSFTELEGPAKVLSEMMYNSTGSDGSGIGSDGSGTSSDGSGIGSDGSDRSSMDLDGYQRSSSVPGSYGGALDLSSSSFVRSSTQTCSTSQSQFTRPRSQQSLLQPKPTVQINTRNFIYNKQGVGERSNLKSLVRVSSGASSARLVEETSTNTIILTPLSAGFTPTILTLARSTPSFIPASPPQISIVEKFDPESIKSEPSLGEGGFGQQFKKEKEEEEEEGGIEFDHEEPNLCISMDEVDGGLMVVEKQEQEISGCAAQGYGVCGGELIDINSLNQTLDLLSMQPKPPGPMTATEKYVIKSRLGIIYWRAEETPAWICTQHRHDIVHNMDVTSCSLCGRKRSKKGSGPMYVITYRIGLEHYVTQGKFLHIGLLACCFCRQKTLKGLDFADTVCLEDVEEEKQTSPSSTFCPTSLSPLQLKCNFLTNPPVVQRQTSRHETLPMASPKAQGTSMSNIERLNESLQKVNPRYKPLGFSITNLESLSPGVLQDTLEATKVALQTVLSSIAPGQEKKLWDAVKPCLDTSWKTYRADRS